MNTDYAQKVDSVIKKCKQDDKIVILSADTDKVKSYVYSSTKPSEMRGASAILDDLNRNKIAEIFNNYGLTEDCLLFNKGGSVLAVVPASKADEIKSEIEKLYPQKTYGLATITVVMEEFDIHQIKNNFNTVVRQLSNKLKQEKEEKKRFPIHEVIPYARRCDSCGIRPANIIDYKSPEETKPYLCKSCHHKRKRGRDEKSEFLERFKNFVKENDSENYNKLICNYTFAEIAILK